MATLGVAKDRGNDNDYDWWSAARLLIVLDELACGRSRHSICGDWSD